jgi:hypothetical protein
MKITIYELLGMIKDGNAPKKIKYENREYYLYDNKSYLTTDKTRFFNKVYFSDLNAEVEILEEEKKIPEKLDMFDYFTGYDFSGTDKDLLKHLEINFETINKSINEIIYYLKSKGE